MLRRGHLQHPDRRHPRHRRRLQRQRLRRVARRRLRRGDARPWRDRCWTPRAIGADADRSRARRAQPRQAPRRDRSRPTRSPGRSGPRSERVARWRPADRRPERLWPCRAASTPASRALLCQRAGRGGRGDPRALDRHRERRGAELLLDQRGLPGPRARPPAWPPALHARPAPGVPQRAWSSRSSPPTRPATPRTRASAATATCGSTRCSSSPTAWAARRWRPATTPASRTAC